MRLVQSITRFLSFQACAPNLLYTKDADKLCIEDPMAFLQYPAQEKGLEIVVNCEARTAGAMIYFPLSAVIAPGVS